MCPRGAPEEPRTLKGRSALKGMDGTCIPDRAGVTENEELRENLLNALRRTICSPKSSFLRILRRRQAGSRPEKLLDIRLLFA